MEIFHDKNETFHVHVYAREPLILYGMLNPFGNSPITSLLARNLNRSCTLLCNSMYSIEALSAFNVPWYNRLVGSIAEFINANSRNHFVFLGSNAQECEIIRRSGFCAVQVNHNCFLNENAITITDETLQFDAIYNAQLNTFKRHQLAQAVNNLALIYGLWKNQDSILAETLKVLPNAAYLNGLLGDDIPDAQRYRYLTRAEVNKFLCKSAVGLCLSKIEGAMYASFEYLLAGLPVISTPSYGGRDQMFPPEFTRIVEPDPHQIALAVDQMARCQHGRFEIRAFAIRIAAANRDRYYYILTEAARRAGASTSEVLKEFDKQLTMLTDGTTKYRSDDLLQVLRSQSF